jgi:DNA polymerase-1
VELVYGEPYDDVVAAKKSKDRTPRQTHLADLRQAVKSVGFGLIYGKAARSLGVQLGYEAEYRQSHPEWPDRQVSKVATEKAQGVINDFFEGLPEVEDFIYGTHREVADTKYTETLLGRRRWFWDIVDWDEHIEHLEAAKRKHRKLCWCGVCKLSRDGERAAVNHRIQGSAADVTMLGMIKCDQDARLRELGAKMLLQVHDELVFEIPDENVEEAAGIIQYHMEHPGLDLRVPLRAPPGIGDNWEEAK